MPLSPAIKDDCIISRGIITEDQAAHLTDLQCTILESEPVRDLIHNGTIILTRALSITYSQIAVLESEPVRNLITNRTITIEDALELSTFERINLESEPVRVLITNGTITIEDAIHLTDSERTDLEFKPVNDLIREGIITLQQVRGLTMNQRRALEAPEAIEELRNGRRLFNDIIRRPAPTIINGHQSTHTASVHQAVSDSATKLAKRYKAIIDNTAELTTVILQVKDYVQSLPADPSGKNEAAKRCVERITADDYAFTDPRSQVTIRQLLALTFQAIKNRNTRVGSCEDADAMVQFVEGLYEIQRGYNLSDTGVDKGGNDRAICRPGAFNKLIEKLQGIDPDCEIRFITIETASLKLPIVVREEAIRYMKSLSDPSTAEDLRAFTRLISQVKEDGVAAIWDQIKGNVADRMFDEFGSLFQNRDHHAFTNLIEAGQFAELPDLSIFQEQVQNSKGYHQYCSQMLRQIGIFSPRGISADYPSNGSGSDPANPILGKK